MFQSNIIIRFTFTFIITMIPIGMYNISTKIIKYKKYFVTEFISFTRNILYRYDI